MPNSKTVESMQFPNSYILMTHLKDKGAVESALHHVGLCIDDINTPNGYISGSQVKALIDLNIELHTSPTPYSIIIAKEFNVATHGVFGLSIASSKNIKEAAKAAQKYSKLINPAVHYQFQVTKRNSSCILTPEKAFDKAGLVLVEINMMVINQFLQLSKHKITPEFVHFKHSSSFPIQQYEQYFGCPVYFDQKDSRIAINSSFLKSPMMFYDPSTTHVLDDHLDTELDRKKTSESHLTHKIKEYLAHNINNTELLTRAKIAIHLNTTPRTLTRKLHQEGACYQTIIEDFKYDIARHALTYTDKNIAQISDDLGFNDPQSFARAFKRWSGVTASSYRKTPPTTPTRNP
ncbi:MAG: AraC family transcriptional regulator [Pseudomonadales bacterium]|nr:AraC family transcriptional regulator [Pseudomonadales bacterium]